MRAILTVRVEFRAWYSHLFIILWKPYQKCKKDNKLRARVCVCVRACCIYSQSRLTCKWSVTTCRDTQSGSAAACWPTPYAFLICIIRQSKNTICTLTERSWQALQNRAVRRRTGGRRRRWAVLWPAAAARIFHRRRRGFMVGGGGGVRPDERALKLVLQGSATSPVISARPLAPKS